MHVTRITRLSNVAGLTLGAGGDRLPLSLLSCPGRVERGEAERNETRDPAQKARSASSSNAQRVAWSWVPALAALGRDTTAVFSIACGFRHSSKRNGCARPSAGRAHVWGAVVTRLSGRDSAAHAARDLSTYHLELVGVGGTYFVLAKIGL